MTVVSLTGGSGRIISLDSDSGSTATGYVYLMGNIRGSELGEGVRIISSVGDSISSRSVVM